MKRLYIAIAVFLAASPVLATTSSVDPNYPGPDDEISSYGLRSQFAATQHDLNELFGTLPPVLSANQVYGAVANGTPTGINMPSCSGASSALGWQSGTGFLCTTIAGGANGITALTGDVISSGSGPATATLTNSDAARNDIGLGALSSPTFNDLTISSLGNGVVFSNAGVLSSGRLVGTDLPTPTSTSLGGIQSVSPVASEWINSITNGGVAVQSQPTFNDISGSLGSGQMPSLSPNQLFAALTTGAPIALSLPNCSASGDGLTWASGVGFGCNTSSGTGGPTTNPVSVGQGGTNATSGNAALDNLFGNTTTGQIAYENVRLYNGGASSYVQQNRYCFNCDPALLRNWRTALAKVRSGQTNARALFLGDSTTFGTGSNNSNLGNLKLLSFPSQLAGLLNGFQGINAHWNSIMADGGSNETNHANDARVTMGSSWSHSSGTNNQSIGGQMYQNIGSSTNALAFTPTVSVDTFVVWYQTNSGNGTFSVDINGSGTTDQSSNSAAGVGSISITGTLGSNTLNIKWVSGGTVNIIGIEAYDSSKKWVDVINAGWAGATSSNLALNVSAWNQLPAMSSVAPNICFIDIGINDWNQSVPVSTYKGNVQSIITACKNIGADVVLITPAPTNPSGGASLATQASFIDAMYALAVSNNVPLIDNYTRFGLQANNTAMYWTGNSVHPNMIGYADFAEPIADMMVKGYMN